ncbi:MAG: hypothetical protein M0Z50_12050 [Planctomycetia bacterium]|nr:hypothetical protein [Planctomycetia bacterium]
MPDKSKTKIIVFGILFWYPLAGVTYQFLHFMLGLRKLGFDPYYIEDSARWIYNPDLRDSSPDAAPNIKAVAPILEMHGLADRWAFRGHYEGGKCYGMNETQIAELYRTADVMINVTGAQELREEHLHCPVRVYLETDPVVSQIQIAQGRQDTIAALDMFTHHFTYGENLGCPDCRLPTVRYHWRPTRQPVLLDLWEPLPPQADAAFNTIATWKNTGRDIIFQGEAFYWSKDREFLKFIDLPQRRDAAFELATGVDAETAALLKWNKWQVADPVHISRDMRRYNQYIRQSRGEFSVAKDQNIRLRSGWFSDRSACYLAAGRPVMNQETGFSHHLPIGRGLFSFQTMDDILNAVDAIESDYVGHCRAAREIAEEYFAAEKVLGDIMDQIGC